MWRLKKNECFADIALLVAALFACTMAYNATHTTPNPTIQIEEAMTLEPDYKTTYISGGMKQTVTTYKLDTETYAEGSARHKAKVAAHLVEFPKDPEPTT